MPPRLNLPPITRIVLSALGVQSLLSFAIRYSQWQPTNDSDLVVPYLQLVPQLSLFYPWTFVTTSLVENNIFTLAVACVTIFYGGRYLERAWTSREFVKFLLITAFIPNLLCFGTLVILFAITGDMLWSLTSINGTIALQISFLVAFSQLVPSHTVTLFRGILSLRVPRFPLLHILLITTLSLVQCLSAASFLLVLTGFLTSFTYLRFYKQALPDLDANQTSTLRGDASESFAFAEFFPDAAKPFVTSVSNQVFSILVSLKICTPFSAAAARGESTSVQRGTPGSARAEAERRRALALKALDQRLNAVSAKASPQSPAGPSMQVQQPSAGLEQPMLGETAYVPERGDGKAGH